MSGFIYLSAILVVLYGFSIAFGYALPPEAAPVIQGAGVIIAGFVLFGLAQLVDKLTRLLEALGEARSDTSGLKALLEGRFVEIAGLLGKLERRSETYESVARRVADAIEAEQRTGETAYKMAVDAAVAKATEGMQPADQRTIYRGREVTIHADGGVSAQTVVGVRRFGSLNALDDYIQA